MTFDFDALYRLVFFGCLVTLFLLERVGAFQQRPAPGRHRWISNGGLLVLGAIVGGLVLPVGLVASAGVADAGWMSALGLPLVAQVAVGFVAIDLWKYAEHRIFHRVPLLWRLHLVHHSDTALDVTTSERHHPIEVVASTLLMVALLGWVGVPAIVLAVYLLVATLVALVSHANLRLPAALDRALACVLVTPRVHAVHHSDLRAETDSNYGSVLTVWDRLFGTYVEPDRARIPHIGLDYFHRASDTRLWRVLLQPFVYAPARAYPGRDDPPAARGRPRGAPFAADGRARSILAVGLAGCLLTLAALWPAVVEMLRIWRDTEAWQYAWLVLPMLVYLLTWHRGPAWMPIDPQPALAGAALAGVAALLDATASLMNIDAGRHLAVVLALQGIALASLGWRTYARLFPTLALLFFLVPYGDLLLPLLRRLTLESIALVTTLAGVPHTLDGYVVLVGARRYIVVDECAGLTYVTLAAFLGYCFALLLHRSFARAAAMALAGALLGVLSNVIRVNAIVLIDWYRGSQMDLTAHGTVQWVMLLAVLAGLMIMLARAAPAAPALVRDHAHAGKRRGVHWLLPPALAAAVAPLVVGLTTLASDDSAPARVLATGVLPAELSGWSLVAPPELAALAPPARAHVVRARYRQQQRTLEVDVLEALDADAKLPESALAPGARTLWREKQVTREVACAQDACVTVRHATWQREMSPEVRHVYVLYSVGTFATDSRLAARVAHGWHRLRGIAVAPRIAAISVDAPLAPADLARAMRGIQAALAGAAALQVAGAQ